MKNELQHQKTLKNWHKTNMYNRAHDIKKLRNRKKFDFGAIAFYCEQYLNEYKLYQENLRKIKELEA